MKTFPSMIAVSVCVAAFLRCSGIAEVPAATNSQTPTADEFATFLGIRSWRSVVPLSSKTFTATLYQFADGKLGERLIPSPAPAFELPESSLTVIAGHENGFYKLYLNLGTGMALSRTTEVRVYESEVPSLLPEKLAPGDYVLFGVARNDFKESDKPSIETYAKGILLRIAASK